ncbi:hypothetical protein SAMD00019534_059950 [Acytostelium subglobosum LB1]|uniref:hypothetical protein n=1 Tax=Acytostelium subglobosum LB1 TaxID=1410327 RepID=UPI000644C83A|nr:hypothetical protein SAMD00019534_059950 [Acytostelium subglobosum LB1]GAM22820.1 hypothetical protein SAMD00019534_059950 [Acytostelium subglobosum LB1]|eukprot:XP_012754047.1 hypothetical protein SAMD00019534_059950 [Acytostelium subglobosum LB1]
MGQESNTGDAFSNAEEDDFFRQINEIQNDFDRGRPRTRSEITPDRRSKKNKWEQDKGQSGLPGVPKTLPPGLTDEQLAALIIRIRIDEITKKLTVGPIEIDNKDDRSRSPTPVYDHSGKRTNTREQRTKDKLSKERHVLVTVAGQVNQSFKPPQDYQPPNEKKTMKIYIPVKEFPEYNFIGLIIGPRGNTQKKMEKESGAKIAIRGKGSMKDGKASKPQYVESEELHVLLTGDTQEQLEKAATMVRQFLVPIEEGKNEHKRQQLRELAEMNGTLRERAIFGGGRNWQPVDIKCVHCGETSHPSNDCPLKGSNHNMHIIEAEYQKFIEEIKDLLIMTKEEPNIHGHGGGNRISSDNNRLSSDNGNNNGGDDSYDEFQAALRSQEQGDQPPPPHGWPQQQHQFNNNNSNNNMYQSPPPHGHPDHGDQQWNQQQQHHGNQQQWGQQQKPQQQFNASPYGPPSNGNAPPPPAASPYGPPPGAYY